MEVRIHKIGTVVQELWVKITDLEARVVPTTLLEEIKQRKSVLQEVVSYLPYLESECQQAYKNAEKAWNYWVEDEQLKQASQNVREVEVQLDKL